MGGVVVRAVHLPGRKYLYGRLLALHHVHLPRRGLRAQQEVRAQVKGVLHVARRVILGRVERGEVVVVGLYLAPLVNLKSHACKYGDELVYYQRVGVVGALFPLPAGQGDVYALALVARLHLLRSQLCLRRGEQLFRPLAQPVHRLAEGGAHVGRHVFERLHERGYLSALAQISHPDGAQALGSVRTLCRKFDLLFNAGQIRRLFLHKQLLE